MYSHKMKRKFMGIKKSVTMRGQGGRKARRREEREKKKEMKKEKEREKRREFQFVSTEPVNDLVYCADTRLYYPYGK